MSTQVRHPIWFFAVRPAGCAHLRLALRARILRPRLDLLRHPDPGLRDPHNEQVVSILYTVVALLGLSVTLFMPMLIERFSRRWIYTAGALPARHRLAVLRHAYARRPGHRHALRASWAPARCRSRSTSTSWTTSARPRSCRPNRCAWPGRCSAGPPGRRSASSSIRSYGICRRAWLVVIFALRAARHVLALPARRQPADPPRQDPAVQPACQYRPLRRATAG